MCKYNEKFKFQLTKKCEKKQIRKKKKFTRQKIISLFDGYDDDDNDNTNDEAKEKY